MFREETLWIRAALGQTVTEPLDVLDVGASTLTFRTQVQPHISENVHTPLVERGCAVRFLDIKADEGVDIVADLTQKNLPPSVFSRRYDLVICCNILEHVADRDTFMANLVRLAKQDGKLLITVPQRYPWHADPIDTMYRPTPDEIAALISRHVPCNTVSATTLSIGDKRYYERAPGRLLDRLTFAHKKHLWRYYLQPFRWTVSCILLQAVPQHALGVA